MLHRIDWSSLDNLLEFLIQIECLKPPSGVHQPRTVLVYIVNATFPLGTFETILTANVTVVSSAITSLIGIGMV